jgi:LPS-assembly protein
MLPGVIFLAVAAALVVGGWPQPAAAQIVNFPARPKPPVRHGPSNEQMLVQATEIHYDYTNERVSAVGNVQIYYSGSTLEADKVIYDQKTKRLHAEGNARLTEADGQVTYGQIMELTDDYRDGFVDSLRLDAPEQTSIAAARAERSGGNFSVFHSGVYTACEPCKDDPKKPPLWQVKAARIIHDQNEKMMYFEQAQLEFFGVPAIYMPYFSAPDPTVKRKTGFLIPTFSSTSIYGLGVSVPYFWALAPDYDFTFTPLITWKQGPLLQGEWRQRLESGSYFIRGAAISQLDPNVFVHTDGSPTPGKRAFRGSLESSGQFSLSDKWVWGWDIVDPTDKTFLQDYDASRIRASDILKTTPTEGISQLYLSGRGDRSYFDARSIYFYGFSESDQQSQIPVVHPVVDYAYTFGRPVFGGELSYKTNLTSLTRQTANFDPVSQIAFNGGLCTLTSADPRARLPANCLLRGFPGTYSRLSGEMDWRHSMTDSYGQVFTPFVSLRADVATLSVKNDADAAGVANYLPNGDTSVVRAMPTAGLEYRYPFINAQPWGSQTIEPIAQIIIRPNETAIGKLPNEDAQSLIFDDSNLFRVNKFSGWDRVEGGSRANVGVQYTAQFNKAGFFNVLFGQSYQLFGTNSFAVGDATNTGLNSGLDTPRSDYVARASYQPSSSYMLTSRFRFDQSTFAVNRFELESRVSLGRWTFTNVYGDYAAQPALGFLTRRQGITTTSTLKLTSNWNLSVGVGYDLDEHKVIGTQFGVGYLDDCVALGLVYTTGYTYSGNPQQNVHAVMLSLSLRTLGGTAVSQKVGGLPGGF